MYFRTLTIIYGRAFLQRKPAAKNRYPFYQKLCHWCLIGSGIDVWLRLFILSNVHSKNHIPITVSVTAWKVSKYGVFSGPYFIAFGPEKTPYLDTFHKVCVPPTISYHLYFLRISKIWSLLHHGPAEWVQSKECYCVFTNALWHFLLFFFNIYIYRLSSIYIYIYR